MTIQILTDRLPHDGFVATCGCGNPNCTTPTIEYISVAPEDVGPRFTAAMRRLDDVGSGTPLMFYAEILGAPDVVYLLLIADRSINGIRTQRRAVVRPLPGVDRMPERTLGHLLRPFWKPGDEIEIEVGPTAVIVTGPCSDIDLPETVPAQPSGRYN